VRSFSTTTTVLWFIGASAPSVQLGSESIKAPQHTLMLPLPVRLRCECQVAASEASSRRSTVIPILAAAMGCFFLVLSYLGVSSPAALRRCKPRQRHVDGVRRSDEQERLAIRRRARARLLRQIAASAPGQICHCRQVELARHQVATSSHVGHGGLLTRLCQRRIAEGRGAARSVCRAT
jgi:hypothetical protein